MYFYSHDGQRVLEAGEAPWNEPGAVHAARDVRVTWFVRRYKLLAAMEAQARRLGITLHYGKYVVEYEEDDTKGFPKGFVTTSAGDRYSADLIVAADGVGTKSHKHIIGAAPLPSSSGFAVYRAVIPIERLHGISQASKDKIFCESRPEFRIYLGYVIGHHPRKRLRSPNVSCMTNRLRDPICT